MDVEEHDQDLSWCDSCEEYTESMPGNPCQCASCGYDHLMGMSWPCPNCHGTGREPYDDYITPCDQCDSMGYEWWKD